MLLRFICKHYNYRKVLQGLFEIPCFFFGLVVTCYGGYPVHYSHLQLLSCITLAFTFLPKKNKDPGYFSDKYTMYTFTFLFRRTYPFIVENSFFALLLMYQWLYFDDRFYNFFKNTYVIELTFVFFPYVLRQQWPQTRFRDSLESTKSKTPENQFFYQIGIQITRAFYIWAKHYIGCKYLTQFSNI